MPPPVPVAPQRIVDEDDIEYPAIEDWLRALDSHPRRGSDGLNYAQYGPDFKEKKFFRIDQIVDPDRINIDDLVTWFFMDHGVAANILKYATTDVRKLKDSVQGSHASTRA